MLPYLIVFIIDIYICNLIDANVSNRTRCIILSLFLIIFNSIFVGFRDFGVGIDTEEYIIPYFQYASHVHSIKDFVYVSTTEVLDCAFLLLACVSRLFGDSPQSLLFVVALFIFSNFAFAVSRIKKQFDFSIAICMALFCFSSVYLQSLNIMRQMCAISLLMVAFSLFLERKYICYCILQIVAYFFHTTSMCFAIVPVSYLLLKNIKNKKWRYLIVFSTVGVSLLLYYNFFLFLSELANASVLSEVYATRYGTDSEYATNSASAILGIRTIISYATLFGVVFLGIRKKLLNEIDSSFILMLLIIVFFLMGIISQLVNYLGRISLYYNAILLLYMASLLSKVKDKKVLIATIFLFGYLVNFYFNYFSAGWDGVNPYSSKILGL